MTTSPIGHPTTIRGRLALIPAKIKARGWGWVFRRIWEELIWTGPRLIRLLLRLWNLIAARIVLAYPGIRAQRESTLFAVYDLDVYPISFDICWFLVWADLERKRLGLERLHCVFVPIADHSKRVFPPGYAEIVDRVSREWRFRNICVQAADLVASRVGVTVCESRGQLDALQLLVRHELPVRAFGSQWPPLSVIYRATTQGLAQAGADWGLRAPAQGMRYVREWLDRVAGTRRPVVITLRQYGVDTQRNSKIDEWMHFAQGLDHAIFCPIVVPDTEHAMDSGLDFGPMIPLFREAAWNLGLRMALYELAYLNMFVNCGPGSLCILNSACRYLFFKVTVDGVPLASGTTLGSMGFEAGKSPVFATPFQRWVWEDDRAEVLQREFDAMVRVIEGRTAPASESRIAHGAR